MAEIIEATIRNMRRLWLIGLFFVERKRDENFSSTQGRHHQKIVAHFKGVGHYPNSITEVRKVSFALVSSFHLRWTTLICITFDALQIYIAKS